MNIKPIITAIALTLSLAPLAHSAPQKVIFDTDFGMDSDDVATLAVIHGLSNLGEADLLGVMISHKGYYAPGAVDSVNTYYNRPNIPIGSYKGAHFKRPYSQYTRELAEHFPNDVLTTDDVPAARYLYRKLLVQQPDHSVAIVITGFLSNMKALMETQPDEYSGLTGIELIRQKVSELTIVGGVFDRPEGGREYNLAGGNSRIIAESSVAKFVVDNWPTPLTFSGGPIGQNIITGPVLQQTPDTNPVKEAYRIYDSGNWGNALLNGNGSWDQTAALYAIRGAKNYWHLNTTGHAYIDKTGYSVWKNSPDTDQAHLDKRMSNKKLANIISQLMSSKPIQSVTRNPLIEDPKPSSETLDPIPVNNDDSASNLALNKNSAQSSTYYRGFATKGNDGNTAGHWRNGSGSVIHTRRENQPWWQVDLGRQADLQKVVLWPRQDCCSKRLSNLYVFVSAEPFSSNTVSGTLAQAGVQAFHIADAVTTKRSISMQASGRYVRVQLIAKNQMLNMAELEVIGNLANKNGSIPEAPVSSKPENLTRNKPSQQSSTYYKGHAQKANDGNTTGHWRNGHGSVIHTQRENQPWWQTDLGQQANLQEITLWPRTDCCSKRLSNLYVFVSAEPFTSTAVSSTLLQKGVKAFHVSDTIHAKRSIPIQASGRYIRVQLIAKNEMLNMAEFKAIGTLQPVNQQAAARESALSNQTAKAERKNVTISIQGGQAKVAYVENMALGKPSQQSSTYYTGFSHKGNDGNTDGSMFSDANSVIHTKREDQPWWQVDLGKKTRLEEVVLWPRIDCCAQELSNLYVFVSPKPFTSDNVSDTLTQPGMQAFHIADIISAKHSITMQAEGRYIRVQLIDNGRMLNIAELEAMGLAID